MNANAVYAKLVAVTNDRHRTRTELWEGWVEPYHSGYVALDPMVLTGNPIVGDVHWERQPYRAWPVTA